MSAHTPGPWLIDGDVPANGTGFQGWLCTASGPMGRMEPVAHVEACREADIALIAAAPDMARVLRAYSSFAQSILDALCKDDFAAAFNELENLRDDARAALAKAGL